LKALFPRLAHNLNLEFGSEGNIILVSLAFNNQCTKKNMEVLHEWKLYLEHLEATLRRTIMSGTTVLGDQPRTRLDENNHYISRDGAAIRNTLCNHFFSQRA
jgi:hypothetical protein